MFSTENKQIIYIRLSDNVQKHTKVIKTTQ